MTVRALGRLVRIDGIYGGGGRITGTVTVDGTPASLLVRLYHNKTGALLREVRSAPNGGYEFVGLSLTDKFMTVARDEGGQFDPAAKSDLIPEPMP